MKLLLITLILLSAGVCYAEICYHDEYEQLATNVFLCKQCKQYLGGETITKMQAYRKLFDMWGKIQDHENRLKKLEEKNEKDETGRIISGIPRSTSDL